jgi:hypothetical protein
MEDDGEPPNWDNNKDTKRPQLDVFMGFVRTGDTVACSSYL